MKPAHVRTRSRWCAAGASAGLAVFVSVAGLSAPITAQEQHPAPPQALPPADGECTVDLALVGIMKDILSNALRLGLKVPRHDVRAFLDGAETRYETGPDLLKAAAAHFKVGEDVLAAKVEKYKHCNCTHATVRDVPHAHLYAGSPDHPECTVDLALAGNMGDILRNAMRMGLGIPEPDLRAFLEDADDKYEDGPEVLAVTAAHFKISEEILVAAVQKYKHCNCTHGTADGAAAAPGADGHQPDDGAEVSAFAKDVILHVVLHELGHALIREFDIPVLGNEETVADAFATYYLTTYVPDRAVAVLTARATSLMIEAGETPEVDWRGEHDDDARRAYQIAALAVAADAEKYRAVAAVVGMSEREIEKARDYGGEIRRSWRRVLAPLWMPDGAASGEARVVYDSRNGFINRLCADGLAGEIASAVKRFDWHSQVTVRFVDGDGGAAWSRSSRTINVHSGYARRFIEQGARGLPPSPGAK